MYQDKFQLNFDQGKGNLVQVSRELELFKLELMRLYCTPIKTVSIDLTGGQPTKCILFKLTVTMRVDSALATRTNTSASRQCLSIHRSRSGLTSIPGLKGKQSSLLFMFLLELEKPVCLVSMAYSISYFWF